MESGTETEGGRSPRLMLNLQRQVISPSFVKFFNEHLVGDRLEGILMESDFRERIVPGEHFSLSPKHFIILIGVVANFKLAIELDFLIFETTALR